MPLNPRRRTPFVKICCIQDDDEADLAINAGADALGLVARMPSGPGVITDGRIAEVARYAKGRALSVLLSSETQTDALLEQVARAEVQAVQLCDRPDVRAYAALRAHFPRLVIIQVVHVEGPDSVVEARQAAHHADALLLDSGAPRAALPTLGGTGRVHDWGLSRAIRRAVDSPVLLAGGLHPGNARAAVSDVNPFGLDVCTGLRVHGRLDPLLLERFMAAIRDPEGVRKP